MQQTEKNQITVKEKMKKIRMHYLNIWVNEHPHLRMGSDSQVSQLRNGKASFGDRAARNLESKWGMPDGYLDGVIAPDTNFVTISCFDAKTYFNRLDKDISDTSLITGNDLLRGINLPRTQFNRMFSNIAPENAIKLLSLQGDMMAPTITNQDVIFVDTSVQKISGTGIYIFILKNQLYVQRLQVTPQGINAISDNRHYDNFTIIESMEKDLIIVAKCIAVYPFKLEML
jgi:hypothetical protein